MDGEAPTAVRGRAAKRLELAFVEHEWTTLRRPDGGLLDGIDVGIAALVEALWAPGYETKSSCENGGEVYGWCPVGMAYVTFATEPEAGRFAQEVRDLPGYDPRRRVEFIRLSAFRAAATVAFETRLIADATTRMEEPEAGVGEPEASVKEPEASAALDSS